MVTGNNQPFVVQGHIQYSFYSTFVYIIFFLPTAWMYFMRLRSPNSIMKVDNAIFDGDTPILNASL